MKASDYTSNEMEKSIMRNRFFENTLHDIKTPFSIIFSVLQSLESRDDLPDEVRKDISKMKDCCFTVSRLMSDVNNSSKIGGGHFTPNYINYDMVFLIESIINSFYPIAARKNIEIIFDTTAEEKIIAIDKNMFERILLNLLSNAIKFSDSGSEVRVNLYDNNDIISVDIVDQGYGISDEKINSIFNRYEHTSSSNASGSGIGLDIVKQMTDALHGNIFVVKDNRYVGTTIRLDLPVFLVAEDLMKRTDSYDKSAEDIFQIELSHHLLK